MVYEWPCSFVDDRGECMGLREHSVRVAYSIAKLLGPRLSLRRLAAGTVLGGISSVSPLLGLGVLAGLTHDLGKSSSHYREKGGRAYPMHEHVSALALHMAARKAGDKGLIVLSEFLNLAAATVARHHAAMECRHPDDLGWDKCSRRIYTIVKASKGLEPGDAVRGSAVDLAPIWLRRYLQESISASSQLKSGMINSILAHSQTPCIVEGRGCYRTSGTRALRIVQTVAGALIVADILVAWSERGDLSEGKPYARSWMNELGQEKVKRVVSVRVEDAEAEVAGLLEKLEGVDSWQEAYS